MIRVAIITVSDSSFAGTREDRSGPMLAGRAAELDWTVVESIVVPDEVPAITEALETTSTADVILTTGGTGVAPRDVTPEATLAFSSREVRGISEMMRSEGLKSTKFAPLSRGVAVTHGTTLIVNLPGSPRGAVESLDAVAYLIPHVVDLLHGRTEHTPKLGP
jgi:molybdopterin adenylyltransferase